MPGCAVVFASERPRLQPPGRTVVLPGIAGPAAVALIRRDLGRPFAAHEMTAVRRLIAALHGRPLALRQAAALVRAHEHTFDGLADRPGELDRLSLGGLSDPQRRALAFLALVGGVLLPGDLVSAVAGVGDVAEALAGLRDRGFVEQRDDRFGLPVCRAEGYLASCRTPAPSSSRTPAAGSARRRSPEPGSRCSS
jgi:hypothetical protein